MPQEVEHNQTAEGSCRCTCDPRVKSPRPKFSLEKDDKSKTGLRASWAFWKMEHEEHMSILRQILAEMRELNERLQASQPQQEEAQEISQCGSSFGGLSSPDTPQAMEVWEQDGVEWMS